MNGQFILNAFIIASTLYTLFLAVTALRTGHYPETLVILRHCNRDSAPLLFWSVTLLLILGCSLVLGSLIFIGWPYGK